MQKNLILSLLLLCRLPLVSKKNLFLHDKTIGYGGNWYCKADGTSTFTISGKDDHQKVTLVRLVLDDKPKDLEICEFSKF